MQEVFCKHCTLSLMSIFVKSAKKRKLKFLTWNFIHWFGNPFGSAKYNMKVVSLFFSYFHGPLKANADLFQHFKCFENPKIKTTN